MKKKAKKENIFKKKRRKNLGFESTLRSLKISPECTPFNQLHHGSMYYLKTPKIYKLLFTCSTSMRSLCMLRYFLLVFLRKKYRAMFYYLIEKHMQKFRHFGRKKIHPKKSLTSVLHQAIQLIN